MRKIIFLLLLLPLMAISQVVPPDATPLENIQITNNIQSTTATNASVQENNGVLNRIPITALPITFAPINYTIPNNQIISHLAGIDTRLGQIGNTTAGITNRIRFTGDNTTVTAGTFFTSSATGSGSVAAASPTPLTNSGNQKQYFDKDIISIAMPSTTLAPPGNYSGQLSVRVSPTPNGTSQRYTIEIYRCNNGGTPIASGIAGAPVGNLGVTVVAILDSGLLNLVAGSVTNISLSGNLSSALNLNTGERLRYHVSAAKVNSGGANATMEVFYGINYASYYDVTVSQRASAVLNDSGVLSGSGTVADALNNLNSTKNPLISHLEYNDTDKTVWSNGKGNLASNTGFGDFTGANNTTGNTWAAFGNGAGYNNTTGNSWTAIGAAAGNGSITGNSWTALGYQAGNFIADGITPLNSIASSIFIGAMTKSLNNASINEIVIGTGATGNGDNSITLGNSSIKSSIFKGRITQTTIAEATDAHYDGYYSGYTSDYSGYNFHAVRSGTGGGGAIGAANLSTGIGDGVIGRRRMSGEGNGGTFKREETGNGHGVYAEKSGSGSGTGGLLIKSGSGAGEAANIQNSSSNNSAAAYIQKSGAANGDAMYVEKTNNSVGYAANIVGGQGLSVNGSAGGIIIKSTNVNLDNISVVFSNTAAAKSFGLTMGKSGVSNDGFGFHNRTDGTYPLFVSVAGVVNIPNLSGTGTRQVVADASGNLSTSSAQPLRYVALVTQSSTSSPTALVIENTLGGSVSWSRNTTGVYQATLTGAFTADKTVLFPVLKQGSSDTNKITSTTIAGNINSVQFNTKNSSDVLTDGIMTSATIEIRVYP